MSVFAQKVAHVNSEQIIQAMPEFTAAQTDIQNLQKQYEEELQRMQDELKTKSEDFDKNQATLPDAVEQRRQQELQDLYQRLQQYAQTAEQELAKARTEKMQAIQTKVLAAIKEVGNAGQYVYVMDISSGIPYISETLSTDVTATVKTKLGLK
jgi:outer membrane protein